MLVLILLIITALIIFCVFWYPIPITSLNSQTIKGCMEDEKQSNDLIYQNDFDLINYIELLKFDKRHTWLYRYVEDTLKNSRTGILYKDDACYFKPHSNIVEYYSSNHMTKFHDWLHYYSATEVTLPSDYKAIVFNLNSISAPIEYNYMTYSRFVAWDGAETETKLMCVHNNFKYYEDDTAQAILLDLESQYRMLIILPINNEVPVVLENKRISHMLSLMKDTYVNLQIPMINYNDIKSLSDQIITVYKKLFLDVVPITHVYQVNTLTLIPKKTDPIIQISDDQEYPSVVLKPKIFRADQSFIFYILHNNNIQFCGVYSN